MREKEKRGDRQRETRRRWETDQLKGRGFRRARGTRGGAGHGGGLHGSVVQEKRKSTEEKLHMGPRACVDGASNGVVTARIRSLLPRLPK
ncbi:hypothetical protein RJT34_28613 [Clitoria ternatea]|uniref:Uncharacterized protein n=1 Tax=Clitoria ternatea TaxID=43366 RepID=A0AAN9FDK1_CLITE